MNLQLTASSEHKDLVKELRIDMDKNLEPELSPDKCCIYRVLKYLRNVNEEAYTPQMVSIGPFHHGKKELANMEKKKRSYMRSFLEKRITIKQQDDIFNFVKNKENEVRNCYSEISDLNNYEYMMMILYDGIFIIELFKRNLENASDSLLSTATVKQTLMLDLELLENQLPYFVLDGIYNLAFCSDVHTFMDISCLFSPRFTTLKSTESTPQFPKHFTDWRRSILLKKYSSSSQNTNNVYDLPCATKLHESGVKFKKTEGEEKSFIFEKYGHKLQLPQLRIFDELECVLRNVIALEQYHYPDCTDICNYIDLMDRLIENEKDVDLLVENGIISNFMGDNSSTANMFNKLCRNISVSSSSYYGMCEELKNHCKNPWNKTMAMLRRVYFSNLWRGTGTIAAVILLLLTVIQTVCSILQAV